MSAAGAVDADGVEPVRRVKSAERAIEILEILGAVREPISVPELHARTGFPRSSLHQLLHTLRELGWIEVDADGSVLGVGPRALLCGTAYLDRDPALPYALRTLESVRGATGYTTHYARLDGSQVLYLATREALEESRSTSRVGRELPAHATSLGKALLAELTDAEVDGLLRPPLAQLTEHTVVDPVAIHTELGVVRERGFALEREENTLGISCVAVAVPYRIPATDAVSCSIPLKRASAKELNQVAKVLLDATSALAARLRVAGIR